MIIPGPVTSGFSEHPGLNRGKCRFDRIYSGRLGTKFLAMYYRRHTLLALLEHVGNRVNKIRFQKLLFLFSQRQEIPTYHFLPCKYGCYSFQAAQDAEVLADRYHMLAVSDHHYSLDAEGKKGNFLATLTQNDRTQIEFVLQTHRNQSNRDLIREVYREYPSYAVNSELLDHPYYKDLRASIEQEKLKASTKSPVLYTIGYEGLCIEQFIFRLIEHGVEMLVDVRCNPLSRKYGFSKNQLNDIVDKCGIRYLHIPTLGIKGSERRNLKSRADYDRLFHKYRSSLPLKEDELNRFQDILREYPRTALTCFEKEHTWCHRDVLAEAIHEKYRVQVEHL